MMDGDILESCEEVFCYMGIIIEKLPYILKKINSEKEDFSNDSN